MKYQTVSEVIVYHDQTEEKRGGNWKGHVLLFIPYILHIIRKEVNLFGEQKDFIEPIKLIYNEIMNRRKEHNAYHKFHFAEISGRKWTKYDDAVRQAVKIGVEALRTRGVKKLKIFSHPIYCKLAIILYHTPTPQNIILYRGEKREKILKYDETLMRMLLKGAIHFLYNKENKVKVLKIISDGKPYHRKISDQRILWRLIEDDVLGKSPLREYVEFKEDAEIIAQYSDHKKYKKDSEEYINANILQLADLLLGCTVYSCYRGIKINEVRLTKIDIQDKKGVVSFPVKEMLNKRKRGKRFKKYSGHYKSFVLSKASIQNGVWNFENITTKEIEIDPQTCQISLFI